MQFEEVDHFNVLEAKIESLINFIKSLKEENEVLREKNQNLERKLTSLSGTIESLEKAKNQARDRIVSLLEKIGELDI
jgi:FtsZ-binding cell division protein ZapB